MIEIAIWWIGYLALLGAAFMLGKSIEHRRMADEWQRIEVEWEDIERIRRSLERLQERYRTALAGTARPPDAKAGSGTVPSA